MRWTRLLLIFLAVLVIIIGGGVVFLLTLDLNDYKDNIERLVERQTGRSLEIDGSIDLEPGTRTSLEVTNTRFGNPGWARMPYMARVARVHVVVDTLSWLSGPIVIESIELDDAELHLESREDDANNWTFGGADGDGDDNNADGSDATIPLVLRQVVAQNFLFTLTTPGQQSPLVIEVDRLTQTQRNDGLLDATLTGRLNDRTVSVSGQYGPLSNLLIATDLQYGIHGKFDTLSIDSSGVIDDLTGPRLPRAELSLSGPDIDDVTEMLGIQDLGGGGLDLTASLQPDADGLAARISGSIGEYVTESSGRAESLAALDTFSVQTSIRGPSLGKAMEIFGIDNVPDGPFELKGGVARDGNRLEIDSARLNVGAAVINLDGTLKDFRNLRDSNLTLLVNGNDVEQFRALIGIPGAATGPFQIKANLDVTEDGAELLKVFMQTSIASLNISGNVSGDAPGFVGTTLEFDGTGKNLADFADVYGVPNLLAEPFSIKGAIELADKKLVTRDPISIEVGANAIKLEGTIGYAPLDRDTDVRVSVTGTDLARIGAMAGVMEMVPAVAFDIRGEVSVRAKGYEIRELDAKIGTGRLTLDGVIGRGADLRGTVVKFSASGPELSEFVTDTAAMDFVDGPFDVSGSAELLAEAVRLQQVTVKVAGATATVDANIGLPLESATGRFDVTTTGPNLRHVLPKLPRWQPPEAPFQVRAKGSLDDGLWSFDELIAQLGDARFSGDGVFDQPPDLSRTKVTVDVQIPNLAEVGQIDGRPLPATNVSIGMDFSGSPRAFSIERIKALVGKADMAGSIVVRLDQAVPDIELQLQSNLLDLTPFLQADPELAEELEQAVDGKQATGTGKEPGDNRLIPDWPLPLELLKKLNARIDIDARKLVFDESEYDDLVLDAELRDGNLVVERAQARTPQGDVKMTLSLVQTSGGADVKATLDGNGIYLGLGSERSAEDVANAPKLNPQVELAGSGLTLREIAATLDGKIEITTTKGRFPNSSTRFLFGNFFEELLGAINPFIKEDPYTELSCLVLFLNVTDGLMLADPGLVAQTDKMNIVSKGELSFVTEKIDLSFKTAPREKVSISVGEFINPYLKVSGTLADPLLTIDPAGVLVTGGTAVATAGLSLLATAVWDRVFREDDPCGAAVEEAKKGQDGKKKKKKFFGVF